MRWIDKNGVDNVNTYLSVKPMETTSNDKKKSSYYREVNNFTEDMMPLEYYSMTDIRVVLGELLKKKDADEGLIHRLVALSIDKRLYDEKKVRNDSIVGTGSLPLYVYAF